ncbi:23S rRNA (guanosine(2251)-2'-O)-methyltransferase RlmB [Philodulcilactobacillus myokoensis]|uniref:23S rRNA (Guanosine(2251)-2'-O)-methyltransferase RlmB n=1 Tax=Philodulcilactobacillus myokoensis TaxID=2929573 RepID=A0A9W6B1D8_9LACO|nr:23S rRNA (guanosine(2251)-2'-O)-methyltransferase RlmB [Philodulcilactobacillus myokoensis]GLB47179.1 23S rRNA (guanosine(2251)-2'-O)-methyltransferase RlmB [Philodulcilactobacillus myokoensis]
MKNNENNDFIMGRHPAVAALRSKQEINKVFLQNGINSNDANIRTIVKLAKSRHLVISRVPKPKLEQMSNHGNHQGVIISIAPFKYATIDDLFDNAKKHQEDPFFVILDNIEDPHNLGSIMRTADAAGAHGIIIPKRRAVGLTSIVAKASAGAIERVPVARVTNLVRTAKDLKERGVWIFGTDVSGHDYRKWNGNGPSAIVIGNEGKGISPLLKKNVDEMLTIPMVGKVQSLNASVAASLLMYQCFNSRNPIK